MKNDIHKTLTDPEGNTYRLYPSWWVRVLAAMSVAKLALLLLVITWLISNTKELEHNALIMEKSRQQAEALADIVGTRLESDHWVFRKTCQIVEQSGEKCIEAPKRFADPEKYPLIVDDPIGRGIFPPKTATIERVKPE